MSIHKWHAPWLTPGREAAHSDDILKFAEPEDTHEETRTNSAFHLARILPQPTLPILNVLLVQYLVVVLVDHNEKAPSTPLHESPQFDQILEQVVLRNSKNQLK